MPDDFDTPEEPDILGDPGDFQDLHDDDSEDLLTALRQTPPPAAAKPAVAKDTRQRYIASVLTNKADKIWDPTDFKAVRSQLYDNTMKAVQTRFPLYNEQYALEVDDLKYADPEDFTLEQQKDAILQGKTLGRRLRGSWVMRDVTTGKEVSRTPPRTIVKVPYLTERGTFIKGGGEYTFNHIMRLEPGVYARRKDQDEIYTQFNPRQGTGTRVDMVFNPSKGVFKFRRGTMTAPAYTVLRDLGVDDDTMKQQWGEELWKINRDAASDQRARQAADRFYNERK